MGGLILDPGYLGERWGEKLHGCVGCSLAPAWLLQGVQLLVSPALAFFSGVGWCSRQGLSV